jgi:hypothetical protein
MSGGAGPFYEWPVENRNPGFSSHRYTLVWSFVSESWHSAQLR